MVSWPSTWAGGGRAARPENPVELGRYAYPSGWNHTAFPYRSQSTGTFYVFAADESFPYGGFNRDGGATPSRAAGWVHVIDWSDWENPQEVARYQVPEAGTHNLWIEDDVMYVAYYNGGLRVVDVSGELMGDLYKQGREIAMFLPHDPNGFIANAPFVWGAAAVQGQRVLHRLEHRLVGRHVTDDRPTRADDRGAAVATTSHETLRHLGVGRIGSGGVSRRNVVAQPTSIYYVYVCAESDDEVAIVRYGPSGLDVIKTISVGSYPAETGGPARCHCRPRRSLLVRVSRTRCSLRERP